MIKEEVASFSFYLGGAIRTLDRIEKRAAGGYTPQRTHVDTPQPEDNLSNTNSLTPVFLFFADSSQ